MRKSRNPRSRFTARQLGIGAILTALALGAQSGCTREFYREWANQDVSEAVFEKTRDPRWRMDIFSVEPPALSRFADPYDQEVPPAPPTTRPPRRSRRSRSGPTTGCSFRPRAPATSISSSTGDATRKRSNEPPA